MGLINGLREGPFSQSISKKYPTSLDEVQERAEKYINMEENARLGETSKSGASYRDKDKESKRKEDRQGEKIKNTITTPLSGHPWSRYTKKSAIQKKSPQHGHSKAKGEEETERNIVNTIESEDTPQTNSST